jgi:thiamine-phosphate pyrophosphorylase
MTDRKAFPITDLYGITASLLSLGRSNTDVVREMIKAGIKIIQYREKERSVREKYRECREIRKLTSEAGVMLIINDHLDLALAVKADGVHLGQDDLPLPVARKLAGRRLLLGISTHSPEQAKAAAAEGADYLGVGPLFATKTKKDVCAPVSLEYLDYVARNISLPFVAIGGIKEHNIALVRSRGAVCCALVSEIVGAPDIVAKVRDLREKCRSAQISRQGGKHGRHPAQH